MQVMRTKLLFMVELRLYKTKARGVAQGLEYSEQSTHRVLVQSQHCKTTNQTSPQTNTSALTDAISKAKSVLCH